MKFDAVILDWAGTTVDYGCFAPVNAFDNAFRAVDIEATIDEIRQPMGMLKRDHIRTMLEMPRIAALWQEKYGRNANADDVETIYVHFEEKLMESLSNYASPKPGVVSTVEQLRKMGLFIGSTTGYTDSMMAVVTERAAQQGYAPDAWFSPDSTGGMGRPYPYMIYRNMEKFRISDVRRVVKVGDTVSDILEGIHAGAVSIGVLEGSSAMGLTEEEYDALSPAEKDQNCERVRRMFLDAGANDVIRTLADLPRWIEEQK